MKNIRKKFTLATALLLVIVTMFNFTLAFADDDTQTDSQFTGEYSQTIVRMAMSIVKANYRFDITDEDLYRNALNQVLKEHPEVWESAFRGIYDNLDKHSMYFDKDEYQAFLQSLSGEICGIGVGIMEFDEGLLVTNVYDDSPAAGAGLMAGDIITHADGTDIRGMEYNIAKSYIAGEEGTSVTIGYVRNGAYAEATMVRKKITVESGVYYPAENNTVGYIKLYSFDEHANTFVQSALSDFDKLGIKNIIMDLRNNPGGSLAVLRDVCQNFIPAGPVIHIEYKNPLRSYSLDSTNKNPRYKLIVLTNENSASAAEAFSGAVQDTGVGIVVGSQSYGKGTMQNVVKFKVGGGIKLTEAVYLTPNKRNINNIGIEPDLKVKDSEIKYADANLNKITYERSLNPGDSGSDVLAVKERLSLLGYNVTTATDIYDDATLFAIKKFQQTKGLPESSEIDIKTQLELENMFIGQTVSDNKVMNTALEIFRTNTLDSYKHKWSPDDYKILEEKKNK